MFIRFALLLFPPIRHQDKGMKQKARRKRLRQLAQDRNSLFKMQRFQQTQHLLRLEISHETLSNSNHPSAIIIVYRKTEGRGIMQSEKPWLSQYPEEIPHELEFTDQTLPSNLTNSAAQFPNQPTFSQTLKTLAKH